MAEEKFLIVGLGNPGKQYADNRHNVGFMLLDLLSERWKIEIKRKRKNALTGEGRYRGISVILAQPQTFMNNSGLSVGPLSRIMGIPADRVLVVYDDLDLAFGRLRLRAGGGAAGHHGMESIIEKMSTKDFPRLRIGIGRPKYETEGVVDFVLKSFRSGDKKKLQEVMDTAAQAVEVFLTAGIDMAMTQFNGTFLDDA